MVWLPILTCLLNFSLPVCSLLVLLLVAAHDSWQQQQQQQHQTKPPRGYCAPISRVVPNKSRCFEHLVPIRRSGPAGSHAHTASNPIENVDREKRDEEDDSDDEELVYVRLETSGSSLSDLSTRAINERLLLGVFDQLFSLKEDDDKLENNHSSASQRRRDVRAQILAADEDGGVASKCRRSMERLVCRLVYPTCHFRRSDVSALVRPPCREDCLLLRDLFCSNLDWSQFAQELQQAFNSTLMAAIKWPMQLEPPPPPALISTSSPTSSKRSDPADPTSDRQLSKEDEQNSLTSLHEESTESVRVPPIHFYWPHEHSLESCERLPPLRPILSHKPQRRMKDLGQLDDLSPISSNRVVGSARSKRSGRRQQQQRQRRNLAGGAWPVCSNAHLTRASSVAERRPTKKSPTSSGAETGANNSSCLRTPKGIDYRGQLNRTSGALECQLWTSQEPHRHTR